MRFFLLAAALMGFTYAADKPTIFQALDDGKLSLVLEGIDNGAHMRLNMTNTGKERFSVVLRAGQTRVDVRQNTSILLNSPEEKVAILDPGKATTLTADQAGRLRMISGRITITRTPAGATYSYEHALIGVPEAK
jgi:hypothetical protein